MMEMRARRILPAYKTGMEQVPSGNDDPVQARVFFMPVDAASFLRAIGDPTTAGCQYGG